MIPLPCGREREGEEEDEAVSRCVSNIVTKCVSLYLDLPFSPALYVVSSQLHQEVGS